MSGRGRGKKGTKQTGAGSSSQPPVVEVQKFKSPVHEQRYLTHIIGKGICKERMLDLKMGEHPDFYNNITRRRWRNFCTLPVKTREDICREFFANAYTGHEEGDEPNYVSFVRGKEITYDSHSIQALLKTAHHDRNDVITCAYRNMWDTIEHSEDQLEAAKPILESISNPGVKWDKTKDGRPKRIWIRHLSNPAKVWFHFMVSTIIPSTNHTEVVVKRAILLWAIMTERPIDLSSILSESIYDMAHNTSATATIGHSSLIQYMCLAAGVEIPTTGGREVKPLPPLDAKWISEKLEESIEEGDGSIADLARAGKRRRVRRKAAQTDGASSSAAAGSVESRLTALETQVGFIRRRNRHAHRQQLAYQARILQHLSISHPVDLPDFQPEPYDGSEEEAAFDDAQHGASTGPATDGQDDDEDAVMPAIVRDAEDAEMDD